MAEPLTQNRPSEIIYQVYPASFADADGDGHGDLRGITSKLEYIKSLDVDAVWISPFFLSPPGKEGDGGYAITDYRQIDPRYGTMEDFEALLAKANEVGLKIYTDFVLCHTSHDHEWFQKSRNREEGYENHYVWHDGIEGPDGKRYPPNNWKSCFTNASAWEWDDVRGQFFLHHFNTSQPALNLNDPTVQDASLGEMKFWLDKGVNGLRIDALPFANYDPELKDNSWRWGWPNDLAKERWDMQNFDNSMCQPQTVQLVERIRELLDSYDTPRIALGEVIAGRQGGSHSIDVAKEYIDPEKGLHTCYTESLIRFWEYPKAEYLRGMMQEVQDNAPDGAFCNNASNHDFPRAATRMTEKAPEELRSTIVRQLMSLYMSLPGSLCLYQGEELGLPQARIREDIRHDQKKDLVAEVCRDGARTPMPWKGNARNAGFSNADETYLPVPNSHYARAVDIQESEPDSMLNFTRELIAERKQNPAMSRGVTTILKTPEPILAFVRKTPEQTVMFTFNMSQQAVYLKPSDYLDEQTMAELGIKHGAKMKIGAYGYSHVGLKGQEQMQEAPTALPQRENDGKKRIFAADLLVADHMIDAATVPDFVAKHGFKDGQRAIIGRDMHHELLNLAPDPLVTLGGSTCLTMWTLKGLIPNEVDVTLMGLAADGIKGRFVKEALTEQGVHLTPQAWPLGVEPQTSVSHVISHASGHNTILTYPATGPEGVKKALHINTELLESQIQHSDVVYIPGSLTQKFGQTFTDEMLRLRWLHEKELILSLPTHADFGKDDAQTFRRLMESANVVVGSDMEFCRMCDVKAERPIARETLDDVVKKVQDAFKKEVLKHNNMPCERDQVAFITRADQPALLVTKDSVVEVPIMNRDKEKNRLGAGDAAAAGFIAGYIKGLSHEHSAKLATALAAEKVTQENPEPHLLDPQKALEKVFMRGRMQEVKAAFNANEKPGEDKSGGGSAAVGGGRGGR